MPLSCYNSLLLQFSGERFYWSLSISVLDLYSLSAKWLPPATTLSWQESLVKCFNDIFLHKLFIYILYQLSPSLLIQTTLHPDNFFLLWMLCFVLYQFFTYILYQLNASLLIQLSGEMLSIVECGYCPLLIFFIINSVMMKSLVISMALFSRENDCFQR